VLKRLFRAINHQTDGGGDADWLFIGDGGGRDGSQSYVIEDQDSFSADAGTDDGGADSFG
jgi:hypothetical protein